MTLEARPVRRRPLYAASLTSHDPVDALRMQRDAEHLHRLGSRAVAEALAEIGAKYGCTGGIHTVLAAYRRLTPEMVRATGSDRFPPRPLHEVPR